MKGTANISSFYGECGTVMYVPRPKRNREKGHIKDLWCFRCKSKHGFKEVRSFDFVKNMNNETLE